jgi:CheY-like chemotaxis protein
VAIAAVTIAVSSPQVAANARAARYLIRKHVSGRPFEVFEASTGEEGVALAQQKQPHVILLDFLLESMTAFDVIDESVRPAPWAGPGRTAPPGRDEESPSPCVPARY